MMNHVSFDGMPGSKIFRQGGGFDPQSRVIASKRTVDAQLQEERAKIIELHISDRYSENKMLLHHLFSHLNCSLYLSLTWCLYGNGTPAAVAAGDVIIQPYVIIPSSQIVKYYSFL